MNRSNERQPDVQSPEPGLIRKTGNYVLAGIRHVRCGLKMADEQLQRERLEVCRSCSSCDTSRMVCTEITCGCDLMVKVTWFSSRCPLKRWPDADSES